MRFVQSPCLCHTTLHRWSNSGQTGAQGHLEPRAIGGHLPRSLFSALSPSLGNRLQRQKLAEKRKKADLLKLLALV